MPGGYSEWSYSKVKEVSYVDDFIKETLRLKPALLTGGARETPAKGLQIGDTFIPGNTNVVIPIHRIQRDDRWWQQPNDFIPERFGERKKEMGTDLTTYLPFSLGMPATWRHRRPTADNCTGAYGCPGKNLAEMSLRTSLSMIAQNFDVSFAPGETGEAFDNEMLDTFTVTLPPLQLQFAARS
jgi:cytochrome P450